MVVGVVARCWNTTNAFAERSSLLQRLGQLLADLNEINMILHAPLWERVSFKEGYRGAVKYQAAHHELVASAIATKLAHEIDPNNKVGCTLGAGQNHPHTCAREISGLV